jgi:hypothetical protein
MMTRRTGSSLKGDAERVGSVEASRDQSDSVGIR